MTRLKFMVLDLSMEFEKILLPSASFVKEIKIRLECSEFRDCGPKKLY